MSSHPSGKNRGRAGASRSGWRNVLRLIWDTLLAAINDLPRDSTTYWAAAIAYYTLLSLFPLLLAAASIAAFFVDPHWVVTQATSLIGHYFPKGQSQIQSIVQGAIDARNTASIISIAALLWTGTRVFGVITKALNIAFDVDETFGFVKLTLIEFAMAATIGVLFMVSVLSSFVLDALQGFLTFLPGEAFLFGLARWATPSIILLAAFYMTYRFVPRKEVDRRAAIIGAAIGTALVMVAQPLFARYVDQFGRYNLIYGSLGIAIILILWVWIISLILLFCGEIASHVQAILIERRSRKDVEKGHELRAP